MSSCISCPAGSYQRMTGMPNCTVCPAGKYNNLQGQQQCTETSPGSAAPTENLTSSESCVPGRYQDQSASVSCILCPVGSAASESGSRVCSACPKGKFSNRTGLVICDDCSAGTIQPNTSAESCVVCETGKYSPFAQGVQCSDCSPGSYASATGSSECTFCPAGKHQNLSAKAFCDDCDPGYVSSSGQLNCNPCPAGYIANTSGMAAGWPCSPQFYSTNVGSVGPCLPCPALQFADSYGSSVCSICAVGTYRASTTCPTCPTEGVTCSGGAITTESGYYMVADVGGLVSVFECPEGLCLSNQSCAANRVSFSNNILCGQCLAGFSYSGNNCVDCSSINWGFIIVFLILIWLLVLIMQRESRRKPGSPSYVQMICYFLQVAILFLGSMNSWTIVLSLFNLNLTEIAALDGSGNTCVAPVSAYGNIVIEILAQIALILVWFFVLLYSWLYHKLRGHRFPKWEFFRTLCHIGIFVYIPMSNTTFNYLNCVVVNGISVVSSTPAIYCNSADYQKWMGSVYFMLILVTAGPVALLFLLCTSKRGVHEISGKSRLETVAMKLRWGVFYERVKPELFWWIVYTIIRRLFIVLCSVFQSTIGTRNISVFQLFFVSMQVYFQPYLTQEENTIELTFLTLLLILSILLGMSPTPYDELVQAVFAMIVFIPIGLMVIYSIYDWNRVRQAKMRRKEAKRNEQKRTIELVQLGTKQPLSLKVNFARRTVALRSEDTLEKLKQLAFTSTPPNNMVEMDDGESVGPRQRGLSADSASDVNLDKCVSSPSVNQSPVIPRGKRADDFHVLTDSGIPSGDLLGARRSANEMQALSPGGTRGPSPAASTTDIRLLPSSNTSGFARSSSTNAALSPRNSSVPPATEGRAVSQQRLSPPPAAAEPQKSVVSPLPASAAGQEISMSRLSTAAGTSAATKTVRTVVSQASAVPAVMARDPAAAEPQKSVVSPLPPSSQLIRPSATPVQRVPTQPSAAGQEISMSSLSTAAGTSAATKTVGTVVSPASAVSAVMARDPKERKEKEEKRQDLPATVNPSESGEEPSDSSVTSGSESETGSGSGSGSDSSGSGSGDDSVSGSESGSESESEHHNENEKKSEPK